MHNNKKLFLSTIVWGDEYLEYFENFCLKSLLIKNINITKNISFNIFCLEEELIKIKNLKNFEKLKKRILINFYFLKKKNKIDKYKYISYYQKQLIKIAKENNYGYFIFCYPDTIFCNNYIKYCQSKLKKYSLLLSPAPLVNFEQLPRKFNNFSKENLSIIAEKFLSNFYKNQINTDYKRSQIGLFKNNYYTLYKCFNLHILAVNLNAINENTQFGSGSFDANFFSIDNFDIKKIYFVRNSQENILLTIESITSERNNEINYNAYSLFFRSDKTVLNKIKRENNLLNVYSFLYGNYYVTKKKFLIKTRSCEILKKKFRYLNDYFPKKKNEFSQKLVKKITINKDKNKDLKEVFYETIAKHNLDKILNFYENNIQKLLMAFIIIFASFIPDFMYPIVSKFITKKNPSINGVKNKYKLLLITSPKKYVIKQCLNFIFRNT